MPALAPTSAETLTRDLVGERWGFRSITVVDATGSTNADLAARVRDGLGGGHVLIADTQTAGRGRFARSWQAVPGANVAMSVSWSPTIAPTMWGWLPLVAGLGVCDGLRELGVDASLKWPNDALLDGVAPGKVAGILAELVVTSPAPVCVIGVGINVGLSTDELPVETATSLRLAGCLANKTDVVAAVLRAWSGWQRRLEAGESVRAAYQERCATVGQRVRVQLDAEQSRGEVIEGVATGVDEVGELVVDVGGSLRRVPAGDVFHVR